MGETVVVTNITGNGGALGSEEVKNASPDGYTCLFYHTCLNINQATGIATTVPRHLRRGVWWEEFRRGRGRAG